MRIEIQAIQNLSTGLLDIKSSENSVVKSSLTQGETDTVNNYINSCHAALNHKDKNILVKEIVYDYSFSPIVSTHANSFSISNYRITMKL